MFRPGIVAVLFILLAVLLAVFIPSPVIKKVCLGLMGLSLPLAGWALRSKHDRDRGYGLAILCVAGLIVALVLLSTLVSWLWKLLGGTGLTPFM